MDEESSSGDSLNVDVDVAKLAAMQAQVALGPLSKASQRFVRALGKHCPVETAASFGGLLLHAELQSNCLRLEILVHLCLIHGAGVQPATRGLLNQGFDEIGQHCGHLEDPREDVFVGGIHSRRGNYRVLEGKWEASTFYLQRFVNIVDGLPDGAPFHQIADAVHALLKLSDVVCERATLSRNDIGPDGLNHVLPPSLAAPEALARLTSFTPTDLSSHRIDLNDLAPFVIAPECRSPLRRQVISHTSLEASPLAMKDGVLYLLLPTAVSVAIRRFFVGALGGGSNKEICVSQLGREYSRLFSSSPFFGEPGPKLSFSHWPYGSAYAVRYRVDAGRYLNTVFLLDDLIDFETSGFSGTFRGTPELAKRIAQAIKGMQEDCEREDDFKEGVTLLVSCGIGRGVVFQGQFGARDRWAIEFVSAPDLIMASYLETIQPLDLFRILKMELSLRRAGVQLQNMNGLLNLIAWADSLDGHLVPHAAIPAHFLPGTSTLILSITQNALADLRHRLVARVDQHAEQFVDGSWLVVRRGATMFVEEASRPQYVHLSMGSARRLLGCFVTDRRCWWYEAVSATGAADASTFQRWEMLGVWVARIAQVIDDVLGDGMGAAPLLWRCIFLGSEADLDPGALGSEHDLEGAFNLHVDADSRSIGVEVGIGFDRAIYHPHNIAEVGLVRALLTGLESLSGVCSVELKSALGDLLSDVHARHSHAFIAKEYRDHFTESVSKNPLTISELDVASLKFGLGWRVRNPQLGGTIKGKQDCLTFLNNLVRQLQDDLIEHVRTFEREALLRALMENYEAASHDRERWHRTAASVLALRNDPEAAMEAVARHLAELNGATQATRTVIEVALCESPIDRGISPGDLDVAMLLAQAAHIFHMGGWSDLIHWDLLEPFIVVRPLGDVHARHDILDGVIDPFGRASTKHLYTSSAKSYAKHLDSKPVTVDAASAGLPASFLEAWEDEFGAPLDTFRAFIDALEDIGIEKREMMFVRSKSQLVGLCERPELGANVIDALELRTRSKWIDPPVGYSWRDIAPSRYRRRLGLLRRPLVMLEGGEDPRYLVNPGLVREGFVSMFRNYYEGTYSDEHLGPSMRKYAGEARLRAGAAFNDKVAEKMEALGWRVERQIKLTKILQRRLDRDYGDVDVLAWRPEAQRVLVMECKDLQFKKTYGEIAEQLSDYRGLGGNDGVKRDSLRKHLDRVEVLRNHPVEVARFVQIPDVRAIESLLVFSHPVPMMFSSAVTDHTATVCTYDGLDEL